MQSLHPRHLRLPALSLVLVTAALILGACGSDDSSEAPSAGNAVDAAFAQDMIPHHKSAVSMAATAQERGEHPEIRTLADSIIKSQSTEISQMEKIAATLKADGVNPGKLGVPDDMMGMSMDESSLKTADPFDKAFVDMMIPHHRGAIRMARAELADGASPEAKELAEAIIAAQTREIGQMNDWRKTWYGAASPSGGVPAADEKPSNSSGEMDHGSGDSMESHDGM